MDQSTLRVEDNMVVSLAYRLTATNGETTHPDGKASAKQIVQGRRKVVQGIEQALYGMAVGEEKSVVVPATEGYGEVDPQAVRTLPRKSVASFAEATPGSQLRLLHKSSGQVHRARVVDVQPDTIVLDFNHPLAGKTLHYDLRVDELRPATPTELESGKVGTADAQDTAQDPAQDQDNPQA
jgi:FKBP-type peptidyl-prolyl cis-trans isomerase SlyD